MTGVRLPQARAGARRGRAGDLRWRTRRGNWGWRPLLLALGLAALPGASRADDLLDLYHQARRADPVLAAADAARGIVREGVDQARAPLLPQASALFGLEQSHVGGDAADAAERNRNRALSAGLSQVVVDLGRVAQLRSAEARAAAQDDVYRAAEQTLVVRVATAYFDVLSAADALANVQANEDAFSQQVEQADERFRQGLTALVDVEQARAYHAAARAETIGAHTALADAREALAELTGLPPGELKTLRDDVPLDAPAPADPQAWVDAALAHHPLLQAQRAGVTAAERDIDAARSGHLPTLNAALGVGRNSAWPAAGGANDGRTVTTVGLLLNVPLFAGGATQSRVRQALHERDAARDDLEARRRRVARDTLDQYRSVVAGIGQTGATRAAVEAARNALASTRVGRQLGTQSMTDLLLAIQTLASAQNQYTLVRHRFVLSRLRLQQSVGAVGETDLAAINALLQ